MRSTWGALLGLTSILFAPILPAIGQDVVIPSDAGMATFDGGTVYSGSAQVGPEGSYLYFRKDIDNGVGYREGFSTIGGFVPLMLSPNYGLFGQGQFFITDEGRLGGNLGGGARYFVESANRMFGVYGFMDFDENFSEQSVEQFGFGFETLGPMWDFRANGYIPLDTDHKFMRLNALTAPPIFSGNTILLNGNAFFQRSMGGGDAEFGVPLLDPSAFGRLRAYFGGYAYDAEKESQIGGRVRLESHINEHITLGAAFMHDDVNGDMVTMAVDIRSWRSSLPNLNNRAIDNRAKMYLPVVRQYRIANDRFLKNITTPALDQNGDQFNIVWVDNSNTSGGDGTFENPFTNLPGNAPGAQYILVRRGDSTITNPVLGGITLEDNQIMFGEGHDFAFTITGTPFGPGFAGTYDIDDILPSWNTNGTNHPFLRNPAGDVITLANNNQVAGFNIVDSFGSGIRGDGISNFSLSQLTIGSTNPAFGNGGAGILLTDVSGVGSITNVELHNNALAGLWVANTNTAPLALTVSGRSGVTPNVTGGDWGLIIDGDNSQINATVTNFHNSGSDNGLFLGAENGALVDVDLTSGSFNNAATGNGINMVADAGSLSFDFTNVTANNANQAGMSLLVTNGAAFVGSISGTTLGGSSFSNNGTDGIALTVDNADVVGNGLLFSQTTVNNNNGNGLNFASINASSFTTNFNDGTINDNNGNNVLAFVDGASSMTINVDPSEMNDAGLNGLRFDVSNGSSFTTNLTDVDILRSGLNGVLGTVSSGSIAFVNMTNTEVNLSGNHGIGLTAVGGAQIFADLDFVTLNNNGQNGAGFDGFNALANAANVNLFMTNSGASNSGLNNSQRNGVRMVAQNGGTVDGDVFNTAFFDNSSDGVRIEAHNVGSLADVVFSRTLSISNGGNGVGLIADTGATMLASVGNFSSFSDNNLHGLLLDVRNAGTNATLSSFGILSGFDDNSGSGVRIFGDAANSISASIFGEASNNTQQGVDVEIRNNVNFVNIGVSGDDYSFNNQNGVRFFVENNVSTAMFMGVSSINAEGNGQNGVLVDVRNSTLVNGGSPSIQVTGSVLDGNNVAGLNVNLLNVAAPNLAALELQLNNNQTSTNGQDGFRLVATDDVDSTAVDDEDRVDVSFSGNFVEFNANRGINVVNRGDANTRLFLNNNLINENAMEGVYIVNTASTNQSANFGTLLLRDGLVNAVPRLDLRFNNNEVTANGTNEDVDLDQSGFVLRVGTSDGLRFADVGAAAYTDNGGFASNGVVQTGRGGVFATINGNLFEENEGADVYFDSFVSTVNPLPTLGTWTDSNTNGVPGDDIFTITQFEQDPLARLDLVFSNNIGDELEPMNAGAFYNNPEGTFKSRLATLAGEAADGVGPFASALRDRNAQRQAFRGTLPPTMAAGNVFMFSGVGQSTFRVQQFGNDMTGTAFDLDAFPYTDPINDAVGVDATGADSAPPQDINEMPWGWSLLP